MEVTDIEIAVFILIIIGCVLCYTLSSSYNQRIEEAYGKGCINWWWSVIIAVLLTATLLTVGENTFLGFLLLTVGSSGLSGWLAYKKMLTWGATSKEARLGSFAQVASAIGIAAAIVFIIFLIFGDSGKKRKRK